MPVDQSLSESKDIKQKVYVELVDLLYHQIGPILVAENVTAFLIVVGLFATTNQLLLALWYLFNLFGSAFLRGILIYKYKHRAATDQRASFWLKWFLLGTILSGISWGSAGIVLLPLQEFNQQAFIIIFLFGVAAAANSFYSPIKTVYISFLLIELLPLAVWLLWQDDSLYTVIAAALFIFIITMLITSSYANKLLAGSLKLRFENKELQEAKRLLESVNEDLYEENRRRKKTEEMLEYLATHDVLTGLPNRALFHKKLASAFAATEINNAVAVLFLDLDNFKKINDTLGHDVGDKLLTRVASLIRKHLRNNDVIARLGGDEFTIIIDNVAERENISKIAGKICNALAEQIIIDGHNIRISVSIGISFYPDDGSDLFTLIKNADIALYHAKALGRNTYQIYTDSLSQIISQRQELEEKLRLAIAKNEFVLFYQPIVKLADHNVIGVEALIRWQADKHSVIPPSHFIPLAEELGLILPLGEWVLQEACLKCQSWLDKGFAIRYIGVNVSPKQFLDPGFFDKVTNALAQSGLAPHYLNLEITESLFIQDEKLVLTTLKRLKEMGIRISLDDFGTGYSSLNYLKQFPIDILKIDRSFIKDVPADTKNTAITKSIVNLANSLSLCVIAEGIETKQQYEYLQSINADAAQGYYIYFPLDAAQIETVLG